MRNASRLFDRLERMPKAQVRALQRAVRAAAPRLVYADEVPNTEGGLDGGSESGREEGSETGGEGGGSAADVAGGAASGRVDVVSVLVRGLLAGRPTPENQPPSAWSTKDLIEGDSLTGRKSRDRKQPLPLPLPQLSSTASVAVPAKG